MRCRRRSRHPPTPHSPPAMPVRCPPTPCSGRAALSSLCPSRRSSLLQRHHLRPLLACRASRARSASTSPIRPARRSIRRVPTPKRWPGSTALSSPAPLVSGGLAGPAIAAFAFLPRSWSPRGTPQNALEGGRSIHLSYWRGRPIWSGRADSNGRPPAPKAGALPGCATPRQPSFPNTPSCTDAMFTRPAAGAPRALVPRARGD